MKREPHFTDADLLITNANNKSKEKAVAQIREAINDRLRLALAAAEAACIARQEEAVPLTQEQLNEAIVTMAWD